MTRLSKASPLNGETLKSLANIKVMSVLDFLEADVDKLAVHSDLPVEKILEMKNNFITRHSDNSCTTGLDLFEKTVGPNSILQTGIENLDKLLDGGLRSGGLYEICGLSGSGKSLLCSSVALNVAALSNKRVLFIDTKGDLSATCLDNFLTSDDTDRILEKIDVVAVKNIYEILSTLDSLKNDKAADYKLIVVDSMTVLYFPFVGLPNTVGLALLNSVVLALRRVLIEGGACALVTNLASQYLPSPGDEPLLRSNAEDTNDDITALSVKPLLGKYWSHVPDNRLNMCKSPTDAEGARILTVVKSCTLPVGKSCTVSLSAADGGIV